MKLIDILKLDINANRGNTKGILLTISYRITNHLFNSKSIITLPIQFVMVTFYKFVINWLMGFEVSYKASIGSGMTVYHGICTVINRHTVIGDNVTIRHATTIGNKGLSTTASPKIGNNVDIGSNCVIIGDIIIGDDVIIGAGSVVVKDIPPRSVYAGNPARLISD